jgi:hypothetical protein
MRTKLSMVNSDGVAAIHGCVPVSRFWSGPSVIGPADAATTREHIQRSAEACFLFVILNGACLHPHFPMRPVPPEILPDQPPGFIAAPANLARTEAIRRSQLASRASGEVAASGCCRLREGNRQGEASHEPATGTGAACATTGQIARIPASLALEERSAFGK